MQVKVYFISMAVLPMYGMYMMIMSIVLQTSLPYRERLECISFWDRGHLLYYLRDERASFAERKNRHNEPKCFTDCLVSIRFGNSGMRSTHTKKNPVRYDTTRYEKSYSILVLGIKSPFLLYFGSGYSPLRLVLVDSTSIISRVAIVNVKPK